jgi:hypothetical protein
MCALDLRSANMNDGELIGDFPKGKNGNKIVEISSTAVANTM